MGTVHQGLGSFHMFFELCCYSTLNRWKIEDQLKQFPQDYIASKWESCNPKSGLTSSTPDIASLAGVL